ncbi:MAG TPA: peptide chain release factor N(5)-glutamine methyltransferase [Bryobacteraceae bacterium]|jgi:release factor glutamine methyltransferase
MTLQEALHQGTKLLEDARIPAPRLTAEVLLVHAVQCRREWLYSHSTDELKELWWIHYGRYLHERIEGKPTQYITHVQEFYGRPFRVSPAVLIPRPETEHLVEAVLSRSINDGPVIDVGTGSGAIAVTLALESKVPVFASDLSHEALQIARANASALGASVQFTQADLLAGIAARSMQMVVSNPPYVPLTEREGLAREVREHEPHVALFGGEDGFVLYGCLIAQAALVLRPGGWLLMELAYNGATRVQQMLELGGCWTAIELIPDLAGYPRVIAASLRRSAA